MMTTDKDGERCRGFIVHHHKDGRRPRHVAYGEEEAPLSLEEAAKVARDGMDRGLRVVVETHGPGGTEFLSGKALVQLHDDCGGWQLIDSDQRIALAEIERKERQAIIAEKACRRLIAPDLETTGDFLDARLADNPLLAFRF